MFYFIYLLQIEKEYNGSAFHFYGSVRLSVLVVVLRVTDLAPGQPWKSRKSQVFQKVPESFRVMTDLYCFTGQRKWFGIFRAPQACHPL